MSLRADQSQALVALCALGALLLTYPLLALFNRSGSVFGVPLLYAWLFGAWALLIALLAWAARTPRPSAPPSTEPTPHPPAHSPAHSPSHSPAHSPAHSQRQSPAR